MRVLQCMAGAEHGGAEAFFVRLVLGLHRAGLEQRVLIRRHRERARQFAEAELSFRQLGFGGALDLMTRMQIRQEINSFKPDVVLSWMNRAASFTPPSRGSFVHCARLGGYYDLKYYKNCDHLIGNTPDLVRYIVEQGWPEERTHYLPNFVSANRAEPIARRALSTPPNARVVFALGRFHENKAFDVLIEAIRLLPDVYLWLAGAGPLHAELKDQALMSGVAPRIRFIEWQENPAPYFAAANVFACPSRIEPLGNVIIESWMHGKPVVAAAAAGPQQLIRDGENGLLVPLEDASALAEALHRVLTDSELAARLVEGGTASYEADFTEERVVDRYMEFFRTVTA